MDQRYVPLSFTRSGTTLTVTAPAGGGVAPPGIYELVLKNSAGVPCVASFVRVGTAGSIQPGSIQGTVTARRDRRPDRRRHRLGRRSDRHDEQQGHYS